ncbi:hypothetical protein B0H21DRAFT_242848 [Amylocystis lapponica]|nr:hypothetical protein B0H21DRAFT_242848 [Amylocystis lapponica]
MKLPEKLGIFARNLWTESIGIGTPNSEIDILRACPRVENLALPSASLRGLFTSIQDLTRNPPAVTMDGVSRPHFPCNLHSITLLTHTFRFDWHFLVGVHLPGGTPILHNITHLRLVDMQISSYVPHLHLPNLTHLALPLLDIATNMHQFLLIPGGLADHPSLQMVVLTIDERKFLGRPWSRLFDSLSGHEARDRDMKSPSDNFREIALHFRDKDHRAHVILSPRTSEDACSEWAACARGAESIWDKALRSRGDNFFERELPTAYPKGRIR